MFTIKKILWAVTVTLTMSSLIGCVTKHNDAEPTPEQAAQAAAEAENRSSPISSMSWCRLDDWDDFQVILRVTPRVDGSKMEYLRVTRDGTKTLYSFPNEFVWEEKRNDDVFPNRYSIALLKDPVAIQALDGFPEQKRISEEVIPTYPTLQKHEGGFVPPMAITMKTRSLTTGDVIPRNMYPCEMYSESFKEDAPKRPFLEIMMIISQELSAFVPEDLNHVATAMAMTYPIEEAPLGMDSLANTQWCSWREVEANRLLLRTITFNGSGFIENTHSEKFTEFPDPASRSQFIADNAAHSEKFEASFSGGHLLGKNLSAADVPTFPKNEMFAFARDSAGIQVMIRLEPKAPETSRPTFTDLYYRCTDERPLNFSTGFKESLPEILDMQKRAAAQ
jgi:hypothetical protein